MQQQHNIYILDQNKMSYQMSLMKTELLTVKIQNTISTRSIEAALR